MYNRQLETFMIAAESGSFSSAAEKLYISSSAVNQQITALENSLDVRLFIRTNRGLSLTPAGELLKKELPSFIGHANHLVDLMKQANKDIHTPIVVGIPLMHNIDLFYDYWVRFSIRYPSISVKFETAESLKASDAYSFYSECDLIEYLDLGSEWMKGRDFIMLSEVPASFAVPVTHPLAQKDSLDIEDLKGCDIVIPGRSFKGLIHDAIDKINAVHGIIHYEESYATAMTEYCLLNNYITIVTGTSPRIPSRFKIIPCTWGISIPYGFSIKRDCSLAVDKFREFVLEENSRKENG